MSVEPMTRGELMLGVRLGKRDQGPALLVVLSDGLLLVHRDTG